MTVSSETKRADYTGNGSTTDFATVFRFLQNSDVKVILTVTATGIETVQAETTNYTLVGAGLDGGGTVTMLVAPPIGTTLTIKRDVPLTQGTDYVENDSFPAESHETALDKLTMIVQQQQEELDRSLKLAESNPAVDVTVPAAKENNLLQWDDVGNLRNVTLQQLDSVSVEGNDNRYGPIFATVAAAVAANPVALEGVVVNLVAGMDVNTSGYYPGWAAFLEPQGSASYSVATLASIRTAKSDGAWVPDEWVNHTAANGLILMLKFDGELNWKQSGAKGLGTGDDFTALQAGLDFCAEFLDGFDGKENTGIKFKGPKGIYPLSAGLKASGTGITIEGESRKGTMLTTAVDSLVLLTIGDVDNAGAGRTWFTTVREMGFDVDLSIANSITTVGLAVWNALEGTYEQLYFNRLATSIDANRSFENSWRDIFIDQNGRTNKANYGMVFQGIADGRNSVGNHLSDIEIRGTSSLGASRYLACLEIRSADGFYMDNSHLYQGDNCFSIKPSAVPGKDKIEAIKVNNVYLDQSVGTPLNIIGSVSASGLYQNIEFSDCYLRGAPIDGGSTFPDFLVNVAVTAVGTAGLFNIKFNGGSMRNAGKTAILCNGETGGNVNVKGLDVQGVTFQNNNQENTSSVSVLAAQCDSLTFKGNTVLADANATASLVQYTGTAGTEDWKGGISDNDFSLSNYSSAEPIEVTHTLGTALQVVDNAHSGRGSHWRNTYKIQTTNATPTVGWSYLMADNQIMSLSARTLGFNQNGQKASAFWQTFVVRKSGVSSPIIAVGGGLVTDRAAESDGATDCTIAINTDTLELTVTGIAATTMDWMIEIDMMIS